MTAEFPLPRSALLKYLSVEAANHAGQLIQFATSAVEDLEAADELIKAQWKAEDALEMLRLASLLEGLAKEIANG